MACACGHRSFGYKLYIDNEGYLVLYKFVEKSIHLLKYPTGWAIQRSIVEAHKLQVDFFEVIDLESDIAYRASPAMILEKGRLIDRDYYGQQIALGIRNWSKMLSTNETKQPKLDL